jgi:hypothetical protein
MFLCHFLYTLLVAGLLTNLNKMNEQILERLRKEFAFVGDEQISGKTAIKIIDDTIERFTIPKHIEDAQKFLQECGRDMGFMGSPEYDRQKKIVDAYFEPIRQKEKDEEEKANYLRLKSKYEGS